MYEQVPAPSGASPMSGFLRLDEVPTLGVDREVASRRGATRGTTVALRRSTTRRKGGTDDSELGEDGCRRGASRGDPHTPTNQNPTPKTSTTHPPGAAPEAGCDPRIVPGQQADGGREIDHRVDVRGARIDHRDAVDHPASFDALPRPPRPWRDGRGRSSGGRGRVIGRGPRPPGWPAAREHGLRVGE